MGHPQPLENRIPLGVDGAVSRSKKRAPFIYASGEARAKRAPPEAAARKIAAKARVQVQRVAGSKTEAGWESGRRFRLPDYFSLAYSPPPPCRARGLSVAA